MEIGIVFLLFVVFILLATGIWIFALVDVIKSSFRNENEKLIWVLIIIFTGFIGAILYYAISEGKRKPDRF